MPVYKISELDNLRRRMKDLEEGGLFPVGNMPGARPGIDALMNGSYTDAPQTPAMRFPAAPADTSTYIPTGNPQPSAMPAAPSTGKKSGLGAALAAALQGFAAGATADVGRATGPGDARTGILKALTGIGRLSAARGAAEARAAERRQGLSDKLAIALAARETPEQAAEKTRAVEAVKQPHRIELQNLSAKNARDKVAAAVQAQSGNLTAAQQIELNNKVLDQVDQRFRNAYNYNPTQDEMSAMVTDVKRQMLSGTKIINLPKELQ